MECNEVLACGRPRYHRGHHGGFKKLTDIADVRLPSDREAVFSPAERAVLRCYASGKTLAAALHDLRMTRATYYHHRSRIIAKTPDGQTLLDALRFVRWLQPPT